MDDSVFINALKIKYEQLQEELIKTPEYEAFMEFCDQNPAIAKNVLAPLVQEQLNDFNSELMQTNATGFQAAIDVFMTVLKDSVRGLCNINKAFDKDVLMVYLDGFIAEYQKQAMAQWADLPVIKFDNADKMGIPIEVRVRRKRTREDIINELEDTRQWLIDLEKELNEFE